MKCFGCGATGEIVTLYRIDNSIWVCNACATPKPRLWNKHYRNAPAGAVNIMRGTIWGNKYERGKDGNREECVDKHRADVLANEALITKIKKELKGKHLVCCCFPLPCHGDIYLKIANEEQ